MLNAGEVLQNRYEILKVIGKGGMSTVYQARDLVNKNLLAIKDVERTGKEQNQVVEQSLATEGRMLMQLSNPHLPRIYDVMENEHNFMLVMDYIQGESLDKVINREGPQPVERVLDWGMQICDVFHYLHNQPKPIIYRDMKPANVMLRPDGRLMMIDFGTARLQKENVQMNADTVCIGTAGFAAPEQYGGSGQSTARTDIFCLGATLYNMITGHSPCDRPMGILPLEQWNPALANSPLNEIIAKCTRNDPDERYQTAMELHADLKLASMGAYQSHTKKSKYNSGNLRKPEWQKQDLKGAGMITGGLSGLLQRNRSGLSGQLGKRDGSQAGAGQEPSPQQKPASGEWQTANHTPIIPEQATHAEPQGNEQKELLQKLTIIAILTAVIFVVLTVALTLMRQIGAAVVFILIALIAAAAAVICMVLSRRPGQS